ncbi:hypothetical protein AABB24_035118 [Solanum stoloniferum]|uniref:Uncharacterized protein n=1 Tax=Solanum stoloniferum TaxID=62892 RepID=A0ABD2R654_9SOLN
MSSEIIEITEEEDVDSLWKMDKEAQRYNIKRIIEYQKSLMFSSSTSTSLSSISTSSTPSSSNSSNSFSKKSNLLNLMKEGSTSLRRLFDMEHTSLSSHFQDYSGSPIIKPHLLWGSDSDHDHDHDPWSSIQNHHQQQKDAKGSFTKQDFVDIKKKQRFGKHKLKRKKSFRKLPRFRFNLWRWGGFRLRRLRFLFCGRVKC